MIKKTPKPKGYEEFLSGYDSLRHDGGEPIGWGFKIIKRLGEEKLQSLKKYGTLICDSGYPSSWSLVTDWLTPKEAIKKYGAITNLTVGPYGGFLQVTYGNTKFIDKIMDPRKNGITVPTNLVTTKK